MINMKVVNQIISLIKESWMPNPKPKIGSQSSKLGGKFFKNVEIIPKPENCLNDIINRKRSRKP